MYLGIFKLATRRKLYTITLHPYSQHFSAVPIPDPVRKPEEQHILSGMYPVDQYTEGCPFADAARKANDICGKRSRYSR
jgi:ABC-type oligopeptide transport system ATPase subunit